MNRTEKWLDEHEVDTILLATPDARREYQSERLFAQMSKALRHARKKSQLSLGEVAISAGINQRTLRQLESAQGLRGVPIVTILKVAHALQLRMDVVFIKEADLIAIALRFERHQ